MTKIYVVQCNDNRFRVMLRHLEGDNVISEEISDKSWATHEECTQAIEQYVQNRKDQQFHRAH